MVSEVPAHDSLLEQLNHSIQSINELIFSFTSAQMSYSCKGSLIVMSNIDVMSRILKPQGRVACP